MTLEEKIKNLPDNPGVYIMRDSSGEIIYIGKAVVLKNRVRQYFQHSEKPPKVQAMVDNIADFDYIITLTERDALTLEATLINKHKPYYNILLKDDKHSPYIKIDLSVPYPTIEVTRKYVRDGSKYFGPYFNGISVWAIVDIIKSAYNMRACPKKLKKQSRACLNYDIGLCKAPCMRYIQPDEYAVIVENVIKFLNGYDNAAAALIKDKMEKAAADELFERAIVYRDQLIMLGKLKERTIANLGSITDIDAFAYAEEGDDTVISVAIVRGSKMIGVKNYFLPFSDGLLTERATQFLMQYYMNGEIPSEVCFPEELDSQSIRDGIALADKNKSVTVNFPQKGQRKKLVSTAAENARDYLLKNREKNKREYEMTVVAAERLAKILGIDSARRMECYDISNISGVDKVASQVVFIDGSAAKREYRRYKIKTVEGANDFASMAEVIKRRLGHITDENRPDLIVVDGGKGQLSAAYEVMRSCGYDIPMVGLAKREEEIFLVGKSFPVTLDKSDYALRLMQRIRDEAHRFAITYHRNLRAKRYGSELEDIPGVGEVRRKILLRAFGSVKEIKEASFSALSATEGIDERTARAVYEFYHNSQKTNTEDV